MVIVLFPLRHHIGFGHDRWRVHAPFHFLLAFTQPIASFFAPFLHFPVTGVSRLIGENYSRIGSQGGSPKIGPAVATDGCKIGSARPSALRRLSCTQARNKTNLWLYLASWYVPPPGQNGYRGLEMTTIKCGPIQVDLERSDPNREFYRRRREQLILAASAVLGVIILGIGVILFP